MNGMRTWAAEWISEADETTDEVEIAGLADAAELLELADAGDEGFEYLTPVERAVYLLEVAA